MKPKIIDLDEIKLVGYQTYGNPQSGSPQEAWKILFSSETKIEDRKDPSVSYGVETYTKEMHTDGKWFYMAGSEVTTLDNMPVDMSAKRLPANQYAAFEYKGAVGPALGEFFQTIYQKWLPEAGLEQCAPYDMERYDSRFLGPENPESVLEILIPVKPKA